MLPILGKGSIRLVLLVAENPAQRCMRMFVRRVCAGRWMPELGTIYAALKRQTIAHHSRARYADISCRTVSAAAFPSAARADHC